MLTAADCATMQADAHHLLPDRCEIRHPASYGSGYDVDTVEHETVLPGEPAVTWRSSVSIPCALAPVGSDVAEFGVTVGDQDLTVRRYVCSIPLDLVGTVTPGLVVHITTATDPQFTSRDLPVLAVSGRSHAVLRRLLVADNLG